MELESYAYGDQCVLYITTGAPVPKYFDSVVQIEETKRHEDGRIEINEREGFKTGQWIRPVGSDVKDGQTILYKGMKVGPAEIGLLASIGKVKDIKVFDKPVIGIVSTGNELVYSHESVIGGNGKIRDSNTHMIISILQSYGYHKI